MIVTGAWWDVVDPIASHCVGKLLRKYPSHVGRTMRAWSGSRDIWKRRTSIICQLGFKQDTDLELLYACIEPSLDSKEFFLRKAIGWALRQYAWTDPREIQRYVRAHDSRLSPLSKRRGPSKHGVISGSNPVSSSNGLPMSFDIARIHKSARRVTRFLRRNSKRPSSEAVHDLRTSVRSLETTFTTLRLDSKKSTKRLLRDLGDVRKRAGKVRDMDVLTAHVLTIKQRGEQDCLVRLLEYLGAERRKYAKKLRAEIERNQPTAATRSRAESKTR